MDFLLSFASGKRLNLSWNSTLTLSKHAQNLETSRRETHMFMAQARKSAKNMNQTLRNTQWKDIQTSSDKLLLLHKVAVESVQWSSCIWGI
jgi:hypothetical protein